MRLAPTYPATLDRSNPLTRDLSFLVVPTRRQEYLRNASPTVTASATPKPGPGGMAWNFPGSGDLSFGTTTAAADLGYTAATWVGVFTATANSTVNLAERNDGNTVDTGWLFGYNDNGFGIAGLGLMTEYSDTNKKAFISDAISSGVNTLVVTSDGSITAANTKVYLNGTQRTLASSEDGLGTSSSDAALTLYVGRKTFYTAASHNGDIYMVGAFKRVWTSAEVAQFHANPWQLFLGPKQKPPGKRATAATFQILAGPRFALAGARGLAGD